MKHVFFFIINLSMYVLFCGNSSRCFFIKLSIIYYKSTLCYECHFIDQENLS